MTENELKQLRPMMAEISDIRKRINKERIITTDGKIAYTEEGWNLFLRLDYLEEQLKKANEWIDKIDDSNIRQIFRHRYVDGMTWQKIAFKIGEYDESYARRRHKRYLS